MLEHEFSSDLGYWVCTTAHLYERAMNERLTPQGITFRQCQVLACLAIEGEISQVDLAERMRIEPPTLVRVLDRMERDRLISRTSCPTDRRRKIIRPLPKSRPIWKKILHCASDIREQAKRGLTRKQTDLLIDLLEIVRTNLGHTDRPKSD
jgi:MarR family transcriptional regulator for hemolysin